MLVPRSLRLLMAGLVILAFPIVGNADTALLSSFSLISSYEFEGDFSDSLGNGSDLEVIGAGALSGGAFHFGLDDGLRLETDLTASDYLIEMDVAFSELAGWNKLIDFQNRTQDVGLYVDPSLVNALTFYPYGTYSTKSVDLSTPYTIGISRIASEITVSLNGVSQFSVDDVGDFAWSPTSRLHFFLDDTQTNGEDVAGSVTSIRLYRASVVPEPTSLALASWAVIGLFGCGAAARRQSRHGLFGLR